MAAERPRLDRRRGAAVPKQLAGGHALEMGAIKTYNDAIKLAGEVRAEEALIASCRTLFPDLHNIPPA
jgi:hypothetical protein